MSNNIQEDVEDKIIDWIALGAQSRLVAFKPEKSSTVLAVKKRADYKGKQILFEVHSFVLSAETNVLVKDFSKKDFKAETDLYLIFAYFDEVKQKVNENIWIIPSLQFKDMAEESIPGKSEKVLRFSASLDIKEKNKYSGYLVNKKDLPSILIDAFEKNGHIKLKGLSTTEKTEINLESLKEFISEARLNTYAGNAVPEDNPRLLGSKQLEFQKGDYFYQDIYFDGLKGLIGQEIIYYNSRPVWGMCYTGNAIDKSTAMFLKESLQKLSSKCRFGQTCEYIKRESRYEDRGQGDLNSFYGQERISIDSKKVHKLDYRGGLI